MLDVYQMLLATYAALDQPMSDIAIKTVAADLAQYDDQAIGQALTRCRKELRRVTLADIIERIPGEHPGPEEAWATMSQTIGNESISVAATQPMLTAYGAACKLGSDKVAGRMAFKEVYLREVSEYRVSGLRPTWITSFGYTDDGRQTAIETAKRMNQLSATAMPHLKAPDMKMIPDKSAFVV